MRRACSSLRCRAGVSSEIANARHAALWPEADVEEPPRHSAVGRSRARRVRYMVREGERMRLHALLVVLVLVPFASHAFTKARCTATQHAIEEREPRPVLLISGFATLTGGVA